MQEAQDTSLQTALIIDDPGPDYADDQRRWQGIPGIERAPGGRLWATWYSGGEGEGPGNYVLLVTSADGGRTWSAPQRVVHPPVLECRCFDPCLWCDPRGRLWHFWAQSYGFYDGRAGVWAAHCDDPDAQHLYWSVPMRLCNGVMMNKPIVLSSGEWCLPAAVWGAVEPLRAELAAERFSNLVISTDAGEHWALRGCADVPNRTFDEHMLVERRDGSLWMLARRSDGIGEAVSTDRGFTWPAASAPVLAGPNARFFIRRSRSGRLILVNHARTDARSHLTAWLSEDDGHTWAGGLLIDERTGVSYPDGAGAPDGSLYVIYDHNRGDRWALARDREILLAVIHEEDILAGQLLNPASRLRICVNRATGA
jgi:predicted neuraminidase